MINDNNNHTILKDLNSIYAIEKCELLKLVNLGLHGTLRYSFTTLHTVHTIYPAMPAVYSNIHRLSTALRR